MERLQKYLASQGLASRRAAEVLISSGRVTVNGRLVTQLGTRVSPGFDRVEVNGRPLQPAPAKVYLALHKPPGYVATARDPQGRPTVMDLVPGVGRLFPVGRLDLRSEGLMLMTNDGDLANRIMHPRYGCEKEYRALVDPIPDPAALVALSQGIDLDDGPTLPARVEQEAPSGTGSRWLRITLREGRKRQVRRMLAAIGATIERLQRVRIGPINLGDLPPGKSRALSRSELVALRACTAVEP